jgi:MFS family permease
MRPAGHASLLRLFGASFCMDGAFYLILTVIPLRAIELRATPLELGLLPLLGSGVYIAAALVFGRLSDRVSRLGMARLGAWLRMGVALALTRADSLNLLMAAMPLLGIASGLFWPALQASLGEIRPEQELGSNLGAFNVSWSAGKMLGFLVGGILIARAGYDVTLMLAAAVTLLAAFLVPRPVRPPSDAGEAQIAGEVTNLTESPSSRARAAWRRIGWSANFVLFGVGATLNYQYPKLLLFRGFTGRDFGILLGGIYFFQTLSFIGLRRWSGWHFRLWPLLLAQGMALVSTCLLGWLHSRALIWAMAPGIGLGLGLSYSSSIYYSLYRETGRGKSTGIHEALLGTGTFLLPLLGGLAVQWSGVLIAPYLLCGSIMGVVMALEVALAARGVGAIARPWVRRGSATRARR